MPRYGLPKAIVKTFINLSCPTAHMYNLFTVIYGSCNSFEMENLIMVLLHVYVNYSVFFFLIIKYISKYSPLTPQTSREPLPTDAVNEIFEDIKDMGVLIGKGGLYGQVLYHIASFKHIS